MSFWLRIVAFFITIIFSWDTVVWSQPTISFGVVKSPEQQVFAALEIPESIGQISEQFFPKVQNQSPVIIHIQDAHANPEAQRNIKAILNYLTEKQLISRIAVEGAFGKINPKILNLLPIQKANDEIINHLSELGEVTGVE